MKKEEADEIAATIWGKQHFDLRYRRNLMKDVDEDVALEIDDAQISIISHALLSANSEAISILREALEIAKGALEFYAQNRCLGGKGQELVYMPNDRARQALDALKNVEKVNTSEGYVKSAAERKAREIDSLAYDFATAWCCDNKGSPIESRDELKRMFVQFGQELLESTTQLLPTTNISSSAVSDSEVVPALDRIARLEAALREAKTALEWEKMRCGILQSPLRDALAKLDEVLGVSESSEDKP